MTEAKTIELLDKILEEFRETLEIDEKVREVLEAIYEAESYENFKEVFFNYILYNKPHRIYFDRFDRVEDYIKFIEAIYKRNIDIESYVRGVIEVNIKENPLDYFDEEDLEEYSLSELADQIYERLEVNEVAEIVAPRVIRDYKRGKLNLYDYFFENWFINELDYFGEWLRGQDGVDIIKLAKKYNLYDELVSVLKNLENNK